MSAQTHTHPAALQQTTSDMPGLDMPKRQSLFPVTYQLVADSRMCVCVQGVGWVGGCGGCQMPNLCLAPCKEGKKLWQTFLTWMRFITTYCQPNSQYRHVTGQPGKNKGDTRRQQPTRDGWHDSQGRGQDSMAHVDLRSPFLLLPSPWAVTSGTGAPWPSKGWTAI